MFTCPKGHALKAWEGDDGLFCDSCLRDVPPGSSMMGCRRCDYDLCPQCAERPRGGGGGAPALTPHCEKGHPLRPFTAADEGWSCEVCTEPSVAGAADKEEEEYECEHGCGFRGGFDAVVAHEPSCEACSAGAVPAALPALRHCVDACEGGPPILHLTQLCRQLQN
eukprot:gene19800-49637_t